MWKLGNRKRNIEAQKEEGRIQMLKIKGRIEKIKKNSIKLYKKNGREDIETTEIKEHMEARKQKGEY